MPLFERREGNALSKRVMVIYGTRPEAVKMAPLIKALEIGRAHV